MNGYSKNNPFAPKDDFSDVESGQSSSAPKKEYSTNNPFAKKKGSIVQSIVNGAALGFGDEAMGIVSKLTGGSYKAGREDASERRKNYAEENPGKDLLGEIAGSVAPAVASSPLSIARAGAGIGRRALAGAAEGAVMGGISGAGHAGDGHRLAGASTGSILGGTVGASLPIAGAIARGLGRAVSPATKKTAESQANRLLANALERDNVAPQDMASRVVGFDGKPAILPDLAGENTLGLARAAQATPSKAKDALADVLHSRAGGQLERVAGDVEGSLGLERQNVHDVAERLIQSRRENAAPLYEEAYAHGLVKSDKIDALLKRPALKKALQAARITAKDEGVALPEGQVDVRTLDYTKRALDDRISSLYRKGANDKARVLRNLRDELLTEVDNAIPSFKAARQQFAGDSQLQDALEAGRNFLNTDPRLTGKAIPAFSEGEREMYRVGALDAIRQAMDKAGDNADLVKRIFGSTHRREQLRAMLDDDEAFNSLAERMGAESRMVRTKDRVLGGSPTARIQSELADMNGVDLGTVLGTAGDVAKGNLLGLASRAAGAIGRRASGNTGKVADALSGKMLTAPGTPEFEALMNALAREQVRAGRSAVRGTVTRRALTAGVGGLGSK